VKADKLGYFEASKNNFQLYKLIIKRANKLNQLIWICHEKDFLGLK
jgi:hypothetical protein